MEWRERQGVRWLEADLREATAAFPTRSAGSLKEDHTRLTAALGLASKPVVSSHQVHGAELAFHGPAIAVQAAADGQVLRAPGPVGLVYTADCLPVALAGPQGAAILHCGWRGLAAGIAARGVSAVEATTAAVGPGIGVCCYEVGDEVLDAFADLGPGIASGPRLDLVAVVRRLLEKAGVESIEIAGHCTRCAEDLFFSHRRDGGPGRQGGLVWLDEAKG